MSDVRKDNMHYNEAQIILYLEDKLSNEQRGEIEEHIADCAACANQLAAISRLQAILDEDVPVNIDPTTQDNVEHLVRSDGRSTSSWLTLFTPIRVAFASVTVIAITVAVYVSLHRPPPVQFRSPESSLALETLFPADGSTVITHSITFVWRKTSADGYRFRLFDATGAPVWGIQLRDTVVSLPSTVVLQPEKTYLWRVETYFRDATHERSDIHAFTYAPIQ